ncbi:MAG TPA: hypothetical protein VFT53_03035 [Candidatus Saccharimonadales bacterium]|nr:hypothetical protein [Candidatus Saccharimonadales bacterium]
MELNKQTLDQLQDFKKLLENYVTLTNTIYSIINHRSYAEDSERDAFWAKHEKLQPQLNILYGSLEDIITAIVGYKPVVEVPAIPGASWDVFREALSGNFQSSMMGDCQQHALQTMNMVVGKAKSLLSNKTSVTIGSAKQSRQVGTVVFSQELIDRINLNKLKILCTEMNKLLPDNPNSAALVMRTIMLVCLRHKLGGRAKEDLEAVLAQAISQDVYKDAHIKKILINFQKMPKALLDAMHHSQWMLLEYDELAPWLPGISKLLDITFP